MCAPNVTIAHMTRTKSHHYHHRAGGLGWAAPHALSVAVHNLKSYGRTRLSGPNRLGLGLELGLGLGCGLGVGVGVGVGLGCGCGCGCGGGLGF